jgi:small-conductance mechanosensitive channel
MNAEILDNSGQSSWQWWERRRLQYNIGLLLAGILAFVLYLIIYFSFSSRLPQEIDVTIFTILLSSSGLGLKPSPGRRGF